MGNSDLRSIAALSPQNLNLLSEKRVAIDAHWWIHRYLHPVTAYILTDESAYTTSEGIEAPALMATLRGLPRIFSHNLEPIFIFDGQAHSLKADEQAARREHREALREQAEAAESEGEYQRAQQLRAQTKGVTRKQAELVMELLNQMGIPYIQAPGAGEAQAAVVAAKGAADYVISGDYDALLFGAERTLRRVTGEKKASELMSLKKTLEKHDLTHKQLVDIGILLGTDYNSGVYGVGPKRALSGIQKHGDIHGVLESRDASIPNVNELRDVFLSPNTTDKLPPAKLSEVSVDSAYQYLCQDLGVDAEQFVLGESTRLRKSLNATV